LNQSSHHELFQLVVEITDSVLQHLPEHSFTVRTEDEERASGRVAYVTVEPTSKKSAPISVAVPEKPNEVAVLLGKDTHFELPLTGQWALRGLPMDDELRDLIEAVVHGKFRERLLAAGDVIFRSHGYVVLDGTEFDSSTTGGQGPIDPHAQWHEIQYEPYGASTDVS
jgi:hypothetical protein